MLLHPPTLLLTAAGALLLASGSVVASALRQKARRGMGWWLAANALLIAALLAQALIDAQPASVAGPLLLLPWPIVAVAGMRRFFARGGGAVPPWADWLALSVAIVATLGTWLAPFDLASPAQALTVVSTALAGYAALALARLDDFATTPSLRLLAGALAASAALQLAWLGVALAWPLPAAVTALGPFVATAGLGLLMTHVVQLVNHDRNIAHLRASQRELRHLVEVDPLTRLPNRRHFHELAERAVKAAPELATVLVFDVDALKRINELLGPANGDEALRQIGTALRETLRRRDVAGRLGGDEFAAVLPRTRVADAAAVIARINARLDDRQIAPRIARVSLNVGATQMLAGESIADAVRRAEIVRETMLDEQRRRDARPLASAEGEAPAPAAKPATRAGATPELGAALH